MQKSSEKKEYLEITYDEKKLPRTQYPEKLSSHLLENHFKEAGSMLDVGCGRGDFLESFKKLGFGVSGVDISPNVAALEKNFDVRKCDFEKENLPYANNSFDYIFSKSVIEHLHQPEKLLDECFRVLKPGGKAVIMCPSWIHTYWGPFYIDHTHVTPFTLQSLRQALEMSGFCVISAEHFIQLPLVWKVPFLRLFCDLIAFLPIPFRPLYNTKLPESFNKVIRFSNEKMLLACVEKPLQ
jgi:SAM-dependent methyltransferase